MEHANQKRKGSAVKKIIAIVVIVVVVALVAVVAIIRKSYSDNLKPVGGNTNNQVITVEPGSTPGQIADDLKAKGLIKSDWAFEWYVRNEQLRDKLKAGTYAVNPSQSVSEIVQVIVDGKEATDLVTILPGKRIDQVKEDLIKAGFAEAEVTAALDPKQYADHPALTDKPSDASLEGYIYPESFQKTAETTVKQVITQSLDEMDRRLTPEVREAFSKQGLTLHQAIVLASVVENEVSNAADRAQAAQVFLKRYKSNIMLGSDSTAVYGSILAGQGRAILYDTPYNTRLHTGLPPGPISNVGEGSLKAIAFPAGTDWLYFVSGDDGNTYFSKTLQEHEELTKKHCIELCKI